MPTILVTGGLGYIGSHCCLALAQAGYALVIVDSLVNSKPMVFDRLREIAPAAAMTFHQADLRDADALERIFSQQPVEAVVHFAGLKAVGESVEKPLLYYANNVGGTVELLEAMARHSARRLVFSSSATVYGEPLELPIPETHRLAPTNPYGRTKLVIEHLLADFAASDARFRYAALRYFNPTGAHGSGRLGEDPNGIPNNLFPYISQVAVGRRPTLRVWGSDYPTPDGTGMRDYIHVVDLADAHVRALRRLEGDAASTIYNVGTERPSSVRDVLASVERITGRTVVQRSAARRAGDPAILFASAERIRTELGWRAQRPALDTIVADAWRWHSARPQGFRSASLMNGPRP